MASPIQRFVRLPMPLKLGIAIFSGAGLAGILYLLPSPLSYFITIGLVVMIAVIAGIHFIGKRFKKRKGKPMESALAGNASVAPQQITAASRRAQLDDLRKKFEDGIAKFKAAGNSLYELPWYLIVGESGSGKTEAIRHANLAFPPGLHDELQGAGGTINMNWWFTNDAVIIDTAGRMLFEEIEAGGGPEWKELLGMLKENRPNCPINGMLLVIPADSLLKDTSDVIRTKASAIARQFDVIQRSLDVRFPVFVVVTKSDRILGFRNFCESIDDPQLQHQMLGWSNPAELDEPFNPAMVDQHLSSVVDRLRRRRLGLLLDPVHTEDPDGHRMDQVDDLYAFPRQFARIAPTLQQYLETIFVSGVWTAKPLFLRGIYFTSAMREGAPLDAELADILGVTVTDLPDGRVWERDRAFFLHDLFGCKVFPEKGLVTRATNAKGQYRRRKIAVLAAGFISVVLLLVAAMFTASAFKTNIGDYEDYYGNILSLKDIISTPEDATDGEVVYGGKDATWCPIKMLEQPPIKIHWFLTFPWTLRDLEEDRAEALRAVYEMKVLRPLVDAARRKIGPAEGPWPNSATPALAQLLRLEAISLKDIENKPDALTDLLNAEAALLDADEPVPGAKPGVDIAALLDYVLIKPPGALSSEDEEDPDPEDIAALQAGLAKAYSAQQWPPKMLGAGNAPAQNIIDSGIKRFTKAWQTESAGGNDPANTDIARHRAILKLKDTLKGGYSDAENDLLNTKRTTPPADQPSTMELHAAMVKAWREDLAKVTALHDSVKKLLDEDIKPADKEAIRKTFEATAKSIEDDSKLYAEQLLRWTRWTAAAGPADAEQPEAWFPKAHVSLLTAHSKLVKWLRPKGWDKDLEDIQTRFLDIPGDNGRRLYQLRNEMYARADKEIAPSKLEADQTLVDSLGTIEAAVKTATQDIEPLYAGDTYWSFKQAKAVAETFVLDRLASRGRINAAIARELAVAPDTDEKIMAAVEKRIIDAKIDAWLRPNVPYTVGMDGKSAFDGKFNPEAAGQVLSSGSALAGYFSGKAQDKAWWHPLVLEEQGKTLAKARDKMNAARSDYALAYAEYWSKTVPDFLDAEITGKTWAELLKELSDEQNPISARGVNRRLEALCPKLTTALSVVADQEPPVSAPDDDARPTREQRIWARFRALKRSLPISRERLDRKFDEDCVELLGKWKALDKNAFATRGQLLKLKRDRFDLDYVPAQTDPGILGEEYWTGLVSAFVDVIAQDCSKNAPGIVKKLKDEYGSLPLANPTEPGRTGKPLDQKQVDEARALIMDISSPPNTESIHRVLKPLAGINAGGENKPWREAMTRVLEAMPSAAKPYICKVYVLPDASTVGDHQADDNMLDILTRLRLKEGDRAMPTRRREKELLGEYRYPGSPVQLLFYMNPTDAKPARSMNLTEQWACVRLLHPGRTANHAAAKQMSWDARPTGGEKTGETTWSNTWVVTFKMNSDNAPAAGRTFRILLEFEKPLPFPWPQWP